MLPTINPSKSESGDLGQSKKTHSGISESKAVFTDAQKNNNNTRINTPILHCYEARLDFNFHAVKKTHTHIKPNPWKMEHDFILFRQCLKLRKVNQRLPGHTGAHGEAS